MTFYQNPSELPEDAQENAQDNLTKDRDASLEEAPPSPLQAEAERKVQETTPTPEILADAAQEVLEDALDEQVLDDELIAEEQMLAEEVAEANARAMADEEALKGEDVLANEADDETLTSEELEEELAEAAVDLQELLDDLSDASRLKRQDAARQLRELAEDRAEELLASLDVLLDALARPEAQTRWQILDTLVTVAADDPELIAEGFESAENALFEEGAGAAFVRLSAFRYFVLLGKSSPERSDEIWPLLNEAAQVYHGTPEYREMLLALLEFAGGNISAASRAALADRVRFDAEGKTGGFIKSYSAQVLEVAEHPENA